MSKLYPVQTKQIDQAIKSGKTLAQVMKKFDISKTTFYRRKSELGKTKVKAKAKTPATKKVVKKPVRTFTSIKLPIAVPPPAKLIIPGVRPLGLRQQDLVLVIDRTQPISEILAQVAKQVENNQ